MTCSDLLSCYTHIHIWMDPVTFLLGSKLMKLCIIDSNDFMHQSTSTIVECVSFPQKLKINTNQCTAVNCSCLAPVCWWVCVSKAGNHRGWITIGVSTSHTGWVARFILWIGDLLILQDGWLSFILWIGELLLCACQHGSVLLGCLLFTSLQQRTEQRQQKQEKKAETWTQQILMYHNIEQHQSLAKSSATKFLWVGKGKTAQ